MEKKGNKKKNITTHDWYHFLREHQCQPSVEYFSPFLKHSLRERIYLQFSKQGILCVNSHARVLERVLTTASKYKVPSRRWSWETSLYWKRAARSFQLVSTIYSRTGVRLTNSTIFLTVLSNYSPSLYPDDYFSIRDDFERIPVDFPVHNCYLKK